VNQSLAALSSPPTFYDPKFPYRYQQVDSSFSATSHRKQLFYST